MAAGSALHRVERPISTLPYQTRTEKSAAVDHVKAACSGSSAALRQPSRLAGGNETRADCYSTFTVAIRDPGEDISDRDDSNIRAE